MNGDFSRSPRPGPSLLSGVWLQQGRALLDADWNAAMAFHRDALARSLAGLIGHAGGPANDAGFAVEPEPALVLNDPAGPGRQYLWLAHAHPEVEVVTAVAAEADPDEDDVVFVAVEDAFDRDVGPDEAAETPGAHTIQLRIAVTEDAAGTILSRPGAYAILVRADGGVVLEEAGGGPPMPVGRLPAGTPVDILVLRHGGRLAIRLGGDTFTTTLRHPHRDRRAPLLVGAGSAPAAGESAPTDGGTAPIALPPDPGADTAREYEPDGTGAEPAVGDHLSCRVLALRLWRRATDLDALAAALERRRPPRRHLLFDLDTSRIEADAIHGWRMRNRAGHSDRVARIGWSEAPPRLRLERYWVGAGSYTVDGTACRLDRATASDAQPFLPDPALADASGDGHHLVALSLWDRTVDALADPELTDPALLGSDTVVQTRTTWQVRANPVVAPEQAEEAVRTLAPKPAGTAAIWRTLRGTQGGENGLLRVQAHHAGWTAAFPLPEPQRAALRKGEVTDALNRIVMPPDDLRALDIGAPVLVSRVPDGGDGTASSMVTRVVARSGSGGLTVGDLPAGTEAGPVWMLPIASFKWSRSNAATAFPVGSIQPSLDEGGAQVGIAILSGPGFNGFDVTVGDWLELTDRTDALLHRPGRFFRVHAHNRNLLRIVLEGWTGTEPFLPAPGSDCVLRLWSRRRPTRILGGADTPDVDAPWPQPASGEDTELDPGVWVRFAGHLASGDYWTAPVRMETDVLAGWPLVDGEPAAQPPHGPILHVAALALLRVEPLQITVRDLRSTFPQLTALAAGQLPPEAIRFLRQVADWSAAWDVPPPPLDQPPASLLDQLVRRWMRGALGGDLRVLAEGADPGRIFEPTGEQVVSRCLTDARWEALSTGGTGNRPRQRGISRLLGRSGDRGAPSAEGEALPSPFAPPAGPGRAVLVGPLLVFAGEDAGFHVASAPDYAGWTPGRELGRARGAAVAAQGGYVLLAGGHSADSDRPHAEVVAIDPVSLRRERIGRLHRPVARAVAVVQSDTLYVVGGTGHDGRPTAAVQSFDLRTGRSRVCGDLPEPRYDHAAVPWGDLVMVLGGRDRDGGIVDDVWLINPDTGAALPQNGLPGARCRHAAVAVPDGIVVAGGIVAGGMIGSGETATDDTTLYHPQTRTWTRLAPLPEPLHSMGMVAEPEAQAPLGARLIALAGAGRDAPQSRLHALRIVRPLNVFRLGDRQT